MLDIQFIRDNAELVQEKASQKQINVNVGDLLKLDSERRELTAKIEVLRAERNKLAEALKSGNPTAVQIEHGRQLKDQIAAAEGLLNPVQDSFYRLLKSVPNMPLDDVPLGTSENDNVISKTVGKPAKFDFEPRNHWQLGELRDWIDKERAAKVAGSRFAYIKGALARLHFALISYGLDVLTDEKTLQTIAQNANLQVSTKPFVPVLPPAVALTSVYEATGRLNGEEQTYRLADDDLWLNASAEHTLCPMYMDEILAEDTFPIRYAGYTTAFRREAGSYGKDMEGIFRLHQFDKLEMESFTTPEQGREEHFFMIAIQEYLMAQLDLPYQVILKCTADIGKPNARGVDINAWLPSQQQYRETHTADYITDYQTRRLKTRVRRSDGSNQFAHTNDATAFSQRPLIAIIENYQNSDGSVRVPNVLQPYIGGKTVI